MLQQCGQFVFVAGVDNARRVEPCNLHALDLIVGAIEQVVDTQGTAVFAEALHQRRDGAHELGADQFGFVHARIFFGKTVVRLGQKA